ncbi:MAG TPA: spirocyclase AveC family protein [Pseudonocardia sp.]|nr:spirocyclase AveC family protein [Pseudonocardia sp.]
MTTAPARPSPTEITRKPSKPVIVWATLGCAGVLLIAVTVLRWITSVQFDPTDPGPDVFGGWRLVSAQVIQYGLFGSAMGWVVAKLVLPAVRRRGLTFDGKLVIAGLLGGFVEPLGSYFHIALLYNAHLPNLGSWASLIPGWSTPDAEHFVQPPLFILGAYVWWVAGFAILAGGFLERLGHRFPRRSNLWLFTVLFAVAFVFALVFEAWVVQSEVYVYPAIPAGFALWAGSLHQYSLWTPVFGAVLLTALAAFRHLRTADGESIADRGAASLRLQAPARQAASTLAVIGFCHLMLVGAWMVPFNLIIAANPDSTSTLPSYLRDGLCGPGTAHPCPGQEADHPRPGQAEGLNPSGP